MIAQIVDFTFPWKL